MTTSSLIVMGAFVVSKMVGLLRDRAIAHRFGAGPETDAYYAAFRIPDLLFTLVAGGALVTAFLPVFSEALTRDDDEAPWRLASSVTNLIFIVTAVLAGASALAADSLVAMLAPGFPVETQALAASLMRWILVSTLIFAVSGIQMGILNAFQHFLMPAVAPALYNIGILFGALVLAPRFGVHGLAYGVIVGAALHLLVKVPILLRFGFRWIPIFDFGSAPVRQVLRLMGPRVVALGVVQLAFILMIRLASNLAPGSVSAFQFAWVLSQLPQTILGTAVGIVAFPTLAELAARGKRDELRSVSVMALRSMLVLTVPATVGMYILAGPAIDLLLFTGRFDEAAAAATNGPLRMFALGLVGHVTLEVVARMFYAQKDTITPLAMAGAAMGLNILVALALVGPYGVAGLAAANSLAVSLEVVAGIYILRRRMGGIGGGRLLDAAARSGAASVVMAAAVVAALGAAPDGAAVGPLPAEFVAGAFQLACGGLAGLAAYALAAYVLRIEEARLIAARLLRRPSAFPNPLPPGPKP